MDDVKGADMAVIVKLPEVKMRMFGKDAIPDDVAAVDVPDKLPLGERLRDIE